MSQAVLLTSSHVSAINFHGTDLYLTEHNGEPYTPMKPIVEGMGLDWKSQHRKLTDNKERWGMVILTIPTAGEQQAALCMPVRKLPAFFASISVNKVRTELRPIIRLYQNECDDVLWKYWTGQQVPKRGSKKSTLPAPSHQAALTQCEAKLTTLFRKMEDMSHPMLATGHEIHSCLKEYEWAIKQAVPEKQRQLAMSSCFLLCEIITAINDLVGVANIEARKYGKGGYHGGAA